MIFKYKHIINNSNTLLIIFQSGGRLPIEALDGVLNNTISQEKIAEYHSKYNWFKLTKNKKIDFLFLEDHFSKAYGWYIVDSGRLIYEQFNKDLEELLSRFNYKNVIAFGSSKGGYGALLYGLINSKINTVFTMVPQIEAVTYIDNHYSRWKKLFFPNKDIAIESKVNNIFFDNEFYNGREDIIYKTNVFLYTGVKDEQYLQQVRFDEFFDGKIKNKNLIVNTSNENHGAIVVDNQDFIYAMLKALYNKKRVNSERLKFIKRGLFVLDKKQ
jgi:hypothetical protein